MPSAPTVAVLTFVVAVGVSTYEQTLSCDSGEPQAVSSDAGTVTIASSDEAFLAPDLAALLLEAEAEVIRRFGSVALTLSADADPEWPELRTAVLTVGVTAPPEEALRTLAELDDGWWLAARDRVSGGLEIDLAFI